MGKPGGFGARNSIESTWRQEIVINSEPIATLSRMLLLTPILRDLFPLPKIPSNIGQCE